MSVPEHDRPAELDLTSCLRELVTGHASLLRRDTTGIVDALLVACRDLTRARRERDASKAELAGATEAHKAFVYAISHDLRAPLRAIDGFSRMLSEMPRGEWAEDANRFLKIICDSVKTMNDQLTGLLSLSRLEHRDLRCTTVDMTTLAQAAVDEARSREPERQVAVAIAALEPAFGDLAMMNEAFSQLVTNAWKATRARPSATIEITCHTSETETVYVIRDDGIGFAPGVADRLFTVFGRLHGPEDFAGLGVGLAVVRTIVTRHRGRVWAEGEPETGAKFYFSLPRVGASGSNPGSDQA